MTLLLLWDIDGTLLQRASMEHARAMLDAIQTVHGVDPHGVKGVDAAGRTDGAIARDILLACGVDDAEITRRAPEVADACETAFEGLCPGDMSRFLAPGIADLLAALDDGFRCALVTGNFEPVARLKLARAGIGSFFEPGQGGFGSDAEDRNELPPIARARAGDWPREQTVIIGDTPRDIECARADGLRVVAVTTGSFDAESLVEANHVASTADELAAILKTL